MRVLYVCPTSQYYGDGKALLNIIPQLMRLGIEPVFVVPSEGDFSNKLQELGYKYFVSNFGAWTTYKGKLTFRIFISFVLNYILDLKKYLVLKHFVRKLNPSIIHSNCTTTYLGYRLSKDLKIPHVWHIREYGLLDHGWSHFPNKKIFEKLFEKPLNYSISITKDIYDYNGKPSKGIVIYDGVFDADKKTIIQSVDEGYFLYVGRVIESKGLKELFESYKKYIDNITNPCSLKIAGEGCMIPKLKKWIKLNNLEHYIELLGYRDDVSLLMGKAKCLIVPSPNEAFGFITAEAMYNGCFVIGKNTAGTKMQFDNCESLIGEKVAFRYYNSNELYERMVEITEINKSDKIEKLHKIQLAVISLYSAQSSARLVYNFYKKILNI